MKLYKHNNDLCVKYFFNVLMIVKMAVVQTFHLCQILHVTYFSPVSICRTITCPSSEEVTNKFNPCLGTVPWRYMEVKLQ